MSSDVGAVQRQLRSIAHYWVATYPYFETTLFLSRGVGGASVVDPSTTAPDSSSGGSVYLELHDADGMAINEAEVQLQPGATTALELDSLLGAAKLESGLKHAHLVVRAPVGVRTLCRIHNRMSASFMGAARLLAFQRSMFLPVSLGPEPVLAGRSYLVCLVNTGLSAAVVKLRLQVGNRSPEGFVEVPPLGARVIDFTGEFRDALVELDRLCVVYARISTRADVPVGVQLIERAVIHSSGDRIDGEVYAALG